jgi:hypothetical protein
MRVGPAELYMLLATAVQPVLTGSGLCRQKNARLALSPQERHNHPITSSMEIGWDQSWALTVPKNGKNKCKETKIVDAQILGPRYVDVISPHSKMYF